MISKNAGDISDGFGFIPKSEKPPDLFRRTRNLGIFFETCFSFNHSNVSPLHDVLCPLLDGAIGTWQKKDAPSLRPCQLSFHQ